MNSCHVLRDISARIMPGLNPVIWEGKTFKAFPTEQFRLKPKE